MVYKLTPLGEHRVLRLSGHLNPESAILNFIYQAREPVDCVEVAGETQMSEESAQKVINRLINAEYIKEV